MKGPMLRQLHATAGAASPGLVNRLLSSATVGAEYRPANDGGTIRGMATGADIMCGPSSSSSSSSSTTTKEKVKAVASAESEPEEAKVNVMPVASSKWWRPDPATGTWVPEGHEGQVTTSTSTMRSPSRLTRIRSETTASLEDKRWWTSMEELPDMDRANPK